MSNKDQQLVDHLYNTIFVQLHRYNYFNSIGKIPNNSVWNKKTDEKKILDIFVDKYKDYYKNKVEDLKLKLYDIKQIHTLSYLTYDIDYYISQYNERMEDVNKYLTELESKTLDHIKKDTLSFMSDNLNKCFPNYLIDPTLLGLL